MLLWQDSSRCSVLVARDGDCWTIEDARFVRRSSVSLASVGCSRDSPWLMIRDGSWSSCSRQWLVTEVVHGVKVSGREDDGMMVYHWLNFMCLWWCHLINLSPISFSMFISYHYTRIWHIISYVKKNNAINHKESYLKLFKRWKIKIDQS